MYVYIYMYDLYDINNDMWICYTIHRELSPLPSDIPHPQLIVELHESLVVLGRISQVWTIDEREWTHLLTIKGLIYRNPDWVHDLIAGWAIN